METVKITTTVAVNQEVSIELPRYFNDIETYYMLLDQNQLLTVTNYNKSWRDVGLFPSIRMEKLMQFHIDRKDLYKAISEEQFKEVFTKVSLELEALMN